MNDTLNTRFSWSTSDFPGNKASMERNSPKMHPTDHISTGVEYSCEQIIRNTLEGKEIQVQHT
jgi:hypothetical protein